MVLYSRSRSFPSVRMFPVSSDSNPPVFWFSQPAMAQYMHDHLVANGVHATVSHRDITKE